MPPAPKSLPGIPANYTSQFFTGDVVTKHTDPTYRARILRCWSDEEDFPLPDLPPGHDRHPLDRPLLRGEVGISSIPVPQLSIVPESSLVLYQREFNTGDIVKRSLTSVESAVVMGSETEVQLEHAIDRTKVKGWIPWSKLKSDMAIEARDRVMFGDWVGIVEEVFEVARVQPLVGSGGYWIQASGGMLEVGRSVKDTFIAEAEAPELPSSAQPESDVITEVHPEIVFVTWNAINQEIPPADHDKYPEPQRFWDGSSIRNLTCVDSFQFAPVQLGMVCRFRDSSDPQCVSAPTWKPATSWLGREDPGAGKKVYRVVESRSKARLRWQDGKETQEWTSSLVPYRNVDDYESWPGEHLIWTDDTGSRRPVCLHSFNPQQRIASVLFMDDRTISTVSVLELDTGGPGKSNYGVGFGQQVLFCPDNAMPLPEVPSLGQMGPPPIWAHDQLTTLTEKHFGHVDLGANARPEENIPSGKVRDVRWWGEVVDLHLDGTVSARLPDGSIRREGIEQLILLNDPLAEEVMGDMDMHMGMPMGMDMDTDMGGSLDGDVSGDEWFDEIDEDPIYPLDAFEMDDYSDRASGQNSIVPAVDILIGTPGEEGQEFGAKLEEVERAESEMDVEEVDPMVPDDYDGEEEGDRTYTQGSGDMPGYQQAEAGPSNPRSGLGLLGNENWQSFDVLEEAPEDHHFHNEPRVGAAKSYHSRMQKEHRALMTSLPENILVRTYEDRSDLMRVLIIGPEGTPYRDAPFIFDVFLSPSKFPHEPPAVFFHSHTNGKGRCNPNLYEDGKVCLSVLGTWAGEKSESWSAKNSSLLQVFVSISGLVLVRHPYHCEPAFAKLEGTREGRINSRLYSEKAFVLSRSFIGRALTHPPTGLEKELRYFYLERGRLTQAIDHIQALMAKGETTYEAAGLEGEGGKDGNMNKEPEMEEEWTEDAMGSLSMGAILTLKRTVETLKSIAKAAKE